MVYYDQVVLGGAYYRPPDFGGNGAPGWTDDIIYVSGFVESTSLSGTATLDDFTATGGTSSALASSLSGAAMLSDFTTTGGTSGPVVLGSLVGSVRSSYPRRYSNAPGARR